MANPAKVIKNLLKVEEEIGDFIANGPSSGFPGHIRDGYRHRCNEFANLPGWARALTGVSGGSISRICKPYWDGNGWDGPQLGEPIAPGGQCPGVTYVVGTLGSATCPTGPTDVSGLRSGPGPVSIALVSTIDTGMFPRPLLSTYDVTFQNGTQTFPIRHDIGLQPCIRIYPADGSPDTCGDEPTEVEPGPNPPPNPGPLPGPEPRDNPDPDNPIPIIPIPDFEDPTFGPQPVTGPDEIPPTAPAPPSGGDGLPGTPDAIADEAGEVSGDGDGEDIDFGEPPEGRIWVGCIVETTTDLRIGNIPGTGPQSTVWPSVRGNVALKYGSKYGKSERINSRFFDLFRPNTSLTVTGCFLQMQPGSTGKVFPISAVTCPENPCAEE